MLAVIELASEREFRSLASHKPFLRQIKEVPHDQARGVRSSIELDMKLRGVDALSLQPHALRFGLGSGACRHDQLPSFGQILDLPTMTFHHAKFFAKSLKCGVIVQAAHHVGSTLKDARRIVAAWPFAGVPNVSVD